MLLGNPRRISATAAPFSKTTGGIPFFLEHGSDGHLAGSQRRSAIIGSHRGVPGMLSGHEITAQGGADRSTRQRRGETNALPGELIDVRCLDVGVSHVTQLIISQFIRHDIDDVRQ